MSEAENPIGERIKRVAEIAGVPALLFLVGWVLYELMRDYRLEDIQKALSATSSWNLGAAVFVSVCNYFVLTFYDTLAFRYVGHQLRYKKIAFASVVSYTVSNTIGFSILSGGAIRYHLYTAWGATASEVAEILAFNTLHFWSGLLILSGLTCVFRPEAITETLTLPAVQSVGLGLLLLFPVAGYLSMAALGRGPVRIRSWEITLPPIRLAVAALSVATLDWLLAALVFYCLLPASTLLSFGHLVGAFSLAQFAGVLSHVPGGLGVFDTAMVLSLHSFLAPVQIIGALILFRSIYYFLPFLAGITAFGLYEIRRRNVSTDSIRKRFEPIEKVLSVAVPPILALVTFVGGAILLISGSLPPAENRSWWVFNLLPLPVLEFSHFLNSVIAVALMALAWAIRRRIDSAYYMAIVLLVAGAAASIMKGLDFEEAVYLLLVFFLFLPSRQYFYRKGSLASSFTWTSVFAILSVLGGAIWLGVFTFKHVEYTYQLWWQFTLEGDASRFLRGSVAGVLIVFLIGVRLLLRPAAPKIQLPTSDDCSALAEIVTRGAITHGYLALLRDKFILRSENGEAFLMYQISGKSWVCLGQPIGPKGLERELMWKFREVVDEHGGLCVFYEVGPEVLPWCVELGLDLMKLGEEAIVSIPDFSIDGGKNRGFRNTLKKLEREGYRFVIRDKEEVPALLPELRRISDDWLKTKKAREKGFSLGFYDEQYLGHCPIALVEVDGEPVAFANVWAPEQKGELSVDLMRHVRRASNGIMDFLFLNLIFWGRSRGYETFNLGMSPLSGIEAGRFVPIWYKAGAYLYRHGENFYNFEGLRAYKDKYNPRWAPRFLAYPGVLSLPRVLMNVTSLISGGVRGIVSK